MLKYLKIALLTVATITLTACGTYEQIPAGHVGKIMGQHGFQPEVLPPSEVRLDTWSRVPERLYLAQTTTQKYEQPIKVLLKDKLTLRAEVVFRGRIKATTENINAIFNDMTLKGKTVTVDQVYKTYGSMIVMNTAREIISKYNVDEVNRNYGRITTELFQALEPKLVGLPIEISDVTIGNIQYPDIVTQAVEKAKEKQMAIEEQEAQVQIRLTELKGKEEEAKALNRIKLLEAERIRKYNEITSKGITKDLLRLRELELREMELQKWDGKLPVTYMGSDGNVPVIVNSAK